MYQIYRERTSNGIRYGICKGQGVLYEADFETKEQAQMICDAHNKGAESYEDACRMAGLDPVTLQHESKASHEQTTR